MDAQRNDQRLSKLAEELMVVNITAEKVGRKKLDKLPDSNNLQSIVLELKLPSQLPQSALKDDVLTLDKPALFLVLDNVQDRRIPALACDCEPPIPRAWLA